MCVITFELVKLGMKGLTFGCHTDVVSEFSPLSSYILTALGSTLASFTTGHWMILVGVDKHAVGLFVSADGDCKCVLKEVQF